MSGFPTPDLPGDGDGVQDASTSSGAAAYVSCGQVTLVTRGGDLLCFWASRASSTNNGQTALSRFSLDGAAAVSAGPSWSYAEMGSVGHPHGIAAVAKFSGLVEGSHTIDFEINNNAGVGSSDVSDGALIVVEVRS